MDSTRGTMSSRRATFFFLLVASGCSAVDPQPAIDQLHADVSERAAVEVDWGAEADGSEAVGKYVAGKLAGEISVDDAVAVSLLKNPRLRAFYRELGIAQSDVVAAGLPENPTISAERRFSGKAAEFDVTQDFLSIFLIPLRRRLGESQFERERLTVTHEVVAHAAEVRTAYFHAQAAEQVAELRRTVVRAMDGGVVAARALRAAGNNATLDVAIAERGANRARLDLADAELEVATTRERVNVLLGLWGDETTWRVPPRLPELPADGITLGDLEARAVAGRLDLAALRAEIEALAQSQGLTRITSILPELSVDAHSEREPEGEATRGPAIALPISIFNRGEAARARAKYLLLQAGDRYAALALEVRSEVRAAFARMETAKRKAEYYWTAVLPTQQVVTDQTLLRYNGMFVGVFDLLEAREEQIDAGRDYIESLAEYWAARTELERVIGRRLPTGMLRPSSVGEPKQPPMTHHHG